MTPCNLVESCWHSGKS